MKCAFIEITIMYLIHNKISYVPQLLLLQQYFGEIKNELFLKNEARNLTFWTTSPIRLGDSSNESYYPHDYANIK